MFGKCRRQFRVLEIFIYTGKCNSLKDCTFSIFKILNGITQRSFYKFITKYSKLSSGHIGEWNIWSVLKTQYHNFLICWTKSSDIITKIYMLKSNTTTTKRKKNYELNNFLFLSTLSLARTLICVLIYIIYFLFTMKIWYCLDKCQFFSDYLTSNIICLDSAASPAPLMSGPL